MQVAIIKKNSIKAFVTRSAKRGLIAFLNFKLQLVTTHSVLSLLM